MGIAAGLAGRPADDAAPGALVIRAHPERERTVGGEFDLPVQALFAEVLIAIGGELGGVGEEDVLVDPQREEALGGRGEPLAVIVGPFGLASLELGARVALGLDGGLGDAGLGLDLADLLLLLGVLQLAELHVDVGALSLKAAEQVGGALDDAGVLVVKLVGFLQAGERLAIGGVADVGAALVFEEQPLVLEGKFVDLLEGHVHHVRHLLPRQAAGAQIGGALEHVLVVGAGGSDHGDTGGVRKQSTESSRRSLGTCVPRRSLRTRDYCRGLRGHA